MPRRVVLPVLLAVLLPSTPLIAQRQPLVQGRVAQGVSGTIGVTRLRDEGAGTSLTGSWTIATPFAALTLVPLDPAVLPQGADARDQSETFDDGSTVCRATETVRFADDALCTPRYLLAASADVFAALPVGGGRWIGLGGGYRVGSTADPYGVALFNFGPLNGLSWQLRGRVGAKLLDLGVGGMLPIR